MTAPEPLLIDTFSVDVPGGRLHGEATGAGAAVVLLHAFGCDRSMWDPQFTAFAGRHRPVRYDMRGFGASAAPIAGAGHVADLLAVLDALGIARAHLVGLSLGGNVALAAAVEAPDRVAGVVLCSPGLPGHRWTTPRPPDEAADIARREGIPAARTFWLQHPLFEPTRAHPSAYRTLVSMVERFAGEPWRDQAAVEPLAPLNDRLGAVTAPMLVINGEQDLDGYREIGRAIHRQAPHAEHHEIAGAGHLVNLEQPDAFNRLTGRFLNELDQHH
ncbi:alpha/beta fold hydrolase [Dactylosporangium sp. CA-092794]|uniref:alpha/beta fold hydrolase n=1 Tax=Dactylosporangium sp. CA-092794 TaxID=3239929 RepID=UPI003D8B7E5B